MGLRASKLSRFFLANGAYKRLKGPPSTPKGYVPVCVGMNNDTKCFMIHTKSLSDAEFVKLLYKSAEEYGFCTEGILRIPYDAKEFEEWMIKRTSDQKMLRVRPMKVPLESM
ncbi:Auxin-induced protein [Macleaya cordata]|uniref:Auxin-induced protein n=1 Tax=Macleaya cordata TaxID=56857 RepID=A0A200QPH4_MACCD|nr:Auxin-induced protein [Macleaya cordata]